MRQVFLGNGTTSWASSSSQYVQESVQNVELYLKNNDIYSMPRKSSAPIKNDYRPEIDSTKELINVEYAYYQSLIGILR